MRLATLTISLALSGTCVLAHPATATAVAVEELAYHSNSIAAVFDVHCILAGNALRHGTEAQQQTWLRPLVAGEIVGAFATSEPGAVMSGFSRVGQKRNGPLEL